MTIYDALLANAELLKALARSGTAVEDVKNLDLYHEFDAMQNAGTKTTYTVAYLCDKYAVSERTVWRIVRKFRRTLPAG